MEMLDEYSEEIKQAYTRIIFFIPAIVGILFFSYYLPNDLSTLYFILGMFILATLAHLTFLYKMPKRLLLARKIFTIFIDMSATTAYLYYLEYYGIIFSPVYLWVIFGNGVRFGPRYLYIAMAMALSNLLVLVTISYYWQTYYAPLIGLLIAIIILPTFIAKCPVSPRYGCLVS